MSLRPPLFCPYARTVHTLWRRQIFYFTRKDDTLVTSERERELDQIEMEVEVEVEVGWWDPIDVRGSGHGEARELQLLANSCSSSI